jgi:glucan phosphoethanolaminetransferase (alkaline phosphatase superfamily)
MEKLNLDKHTLRKFGLTMGMVFLIITFWFLFRHKYSPLTTAIVSATFFLFAFFTPLILKPIYIFWMRLAFILGWINTRLLLIVVFYLIFTPIGLAMKLFNFDPLQRKIEKNKNSYWIKKIRREFNPLDYERQF